MSAPEPIAFHLRGAGETLQLGAVLGDALASEPAPCAPAFVLLSGELGAGKTTFVRGLAEGLGADPAAVASPTFTIRMDHRGVRPLVHVDAWRIGTEDLESIGFDETGAGDAVVAIEWPERIADGLPPGHLRVRLEHAGTHVPPPGPTAPDDAAGEPDARAPEGADANADRDPHADADPGRIATIDASALEPRRARRILDALALLVRAPRISSPRCPTCGRPVGGGGAAGSGRANDAGGGEMHRPSAGVVWLRGPSSSEFAPPPPSSSPDAPFCSPRCRLADFGDWLAMRHRISGPDSPEFDESA